MMRLSTLIAGLILSGFLISAVSAAPLDNSIKPKQPQGIVNSKKVMKHKIEQDKKKDEIRKKGQANRHQLKNG